MFHLIPAPAHRLALRLAHAIRKRWWRWRRPHLTGCRVLAFDPQGRVLLIRHSYGSGKWMLPGGGIGRGEAVLAAAIRETREETGCLLGDATVFEVLDEPLYGARNHVHLVCGQTADTPRPDGREVLAATFHDAERLPEQLAQGFAAALPGWITAAKAGLPDEG